MARIVSLFDMSNVTFGPATIASINQSGLLSPSQAALKIMDNSSWPVYATGPYTIVFHLRAPFSYFPGTLVAYEGLMFDSQYVLTHGGFGTATLFNTAFNQNPIPGSGPYTVTHVSENSYVPVRTGPNYWGKNLSQADLSVQPILYPAMLKMS